MATARLVFRFELTDREEEQIRLIAAYYLTRESIVTSGGWDRPATVDVEVYQALARREDVVAAIVGRVGKGYDTGLLRKKAEVQG